MNKKEEIALVYMVAGISSRFGGKIKQFAQVGPRDESLIEVSLKQALKSGFTKIVFIVGKMTAEPFKKKFGNTYQGLRVDYALQSYDEKDRDKPWGTVDALVSAKSLLKCPFIVCNGDDLYGEGAFKILFEHLTKSNKEATLGYRLSDVLPDSGSATRGIMIVDSEGKVKEIVETFNIVKSELEKIKINPDSLCSMKYFAFHPEVLELLYKKLIDFKEKNQGNRKAECLLPIETNNLIREKKVEIKLYTTNEKWLGITNPEDEESVRRELNILESRKNE